MLVPKEVISSLEFHEPKQKKEEKIKGKEGEELFQVKFSTFAYINFLTLLLWLKPLTNAWEIRTQFLIFAYFLCCLHPLHNFWISTILAVHFRCRTKHIDILFERDCYKDWETTFNLNVYLINAWMQITILTDFRNLLFWRNILTTDWTNTASR